MREIKFRAWDKVKREMFEPKEFVRNHYALNCQTDLVGLIFSGMENAQHFELMQFTGLKDKNGKEIYEGDILQWGKYDKYKVIWNKRDCGFVVEWLKKPTIHEELDSDFTIIGNIYENQELLDSK